MNTTKIKKTSRTFDEIIEDTRASLPELAPNWTSHGYDEVGMALIELAAGMIDGLNYHLDKQVLETYLPTARLRQSVLRIANTIGYRPSRWVAPEGLMTVVATGYKDSIYIPARSQFRSSSGVLIALKDSVAIPANFVGEVQFKVVEGVTREIRQSGTGLNLQTVTLQHDQVAEQMLEVFTDSSVPKPWYHAFDHPLDPTLTRLYYANETVRGEYQIVFRKGRSSVPTTEETIIVRYVHTQNLAPKQAGDLLPQFNFAGLDTLTFRHGIFADGAQPESIESIKQRAPAIIYSRDRAVTRLDYQELARLTPTVKNVYVVKDAGGWRSVDVYVALETPTTPTAELLATVQQQLSTLNEVTVDVRTWPAELAPFTINLNLRVSEGYSTVEVKTNVRRALEDKYKYAAMDIAKIVRMSDVYQTIEGVDGVDWSELTMLNWTNGEAKAMSLKPTESQHPYLNSLTVEVVS